MREVNPNTRVLILEHKDTIHPLAIDKTGTVKLIQDYKGTEMYYVQMDEKIDGLPPYKALNIPIGYCYIAIKEELAFI
jgi:hypothetical protein